MANYREKRGGDQAQETHGGGARLVARMQAARPPVIAPSPARKADDRQADRPALHQPHRLRLHGVPDDEAGDARQILLTRAPSGMLVRARPNG
jgi:hypothetical protein